MTSQPNGPIVQCLSSCSDSTDPTLCQTCHPQCNGCTGTTNTDCVQCLKDSMPVQGSNNVRCIPRCDTNEYLVEGPPGEYTCQPCHQECLNCTGPTQAECNTCRNVYILRKQDGLKVCRSACTTGSMFESSRGECLTCDTQCNGCNGTTSFDCIECAGTSMVTSTGRTQCIASCPAGQVYDTAAGQCTIDQ